VLGRAADFRKFAKHLKRFVRLGILEPVTQGHLEKKRMRAARLSYEYRYPHPLND
jgi:hypothetical protein